MLCGFYHGGLPYFDSPRADLITDKFLREGIMKKPVLIAILILCGVLMYGHVSHAGSVLEGILKKGDLVVGVSGNQPPLNAAARSGDIIGLEADLARAVAAAMNVKVRFSRMAFSDLLPALQAGRVDMVISGVSMTPERNLKFAFIGPYLVSGKGVLARISSVQKLTTDGINNPHIRVATLKDSTSQAVAEKNAPRAQLVLTGSYDEALLLLFQDKVNAVIADVPYCAYVVARYPDKGIAFGESRLSVEPLGIAVREDALLINALENFLKMFIGSGELKALQDKWFKSGEWIRQLP